MSEYNDDDFLTTYAEETENQIVVLNRIIVGLRSKVSLLEKELEAAQQIPVPKSVVKQIIELEAKNRKLESDLEYYKKYVPSQIIINKEQKEKPARRGGVPK